MKKRTRVLAWIMLVYSAYGCLVALPMLVFRPLPATWLTIGILSVVVQLPLWLYLLKWRPWAWWGLTVLYSIGLIVEIRKLALTPGYWLDRGVALPGMAVRTTLGLVFDLVFLIPIFFLLTDRPGGWGQGST